MKKTATAHNLSINALLEALHQIPAGYKYVDAIVADELTLKFKPSKWQGEDSQPPEEEGDEDPDINQLIA
jgi:hypothetical protein